MALFIRYACFILLFFPYHAIVAFEPITVIAASISIVTGIITFAKQLWEAVDSAYVLVGEEPDMDGEHYKRPYNSIERNLMEQLRYLSRENGQLKIDIENMKDEIISKVIENVPGLVELNRRLGIIFVNSLTIDKSYDNFLRYIDKPEKYDSNILIEFAIQTISEGTCGLNYLLDEIYSLLVLDDVTSPSAIRLLIHHMQSFKVPKSPQLLLYNLMNSVIYAEIKSFLTLKYSYQILQLYKRGHYEGHIEKSENAFANRVNNTIAAFKSVMSVASRELRKNDPAQHIEDVTYTELKQLFQEIIINEADIRKYGSCGGICYNDKIKEQYRNKMVFDKCSYNTEICAQQRVCNGYLSNCRYKIDTEMHVCLSDKNSSRRYEYIDYGNGQRYGLRGQTCTRNVVNVKSEGLIPRLHPCAPCICVCSDKGPKSDQYINLDDMKARSWDNYVITGARFVKQENMLHIQIQEGQLLPNGNINKSTVVWVPVVKPTTHTTPLWNCCNEINLNDVQAPKGHVLTGLSFVQVPYGKVGQKRILLSIIYAPLNFTSGKVLHDYTGKVFSKLSSEEILLNNVDIPTRTGVGNVIISKPNQFTRFVPTGLTIDVGQSTIPFIDIQNLTTNPPTPMSGVGIYHKRKIGNGGFIALKLFTYDFEPHLLANLPEDYASPKDLRN